MLHPMSIRCLSLSCFPNMNLLNLTVEGVFWASDVLRSPIFPLVVCSVPIILCIFSLYNFPYVQFLLRVRTHDPCRFRFDYTAPFDDDKTNWATTLCNKSKGKFNFWTNFYCAWGNKTVLEGWGILVSRQCDILLIDFKNFKEIFQNIHF